MRIRHGARSGRRRFGSLPSMLGIAIMVSGMLGLTGATSLSAHQARPQLPILRLPGGPGFVLDNTEGPAGYSPPFLAVNAGLVQLLPNNNVAPDLATLTISPNHLVYTFTIRPNARFSNGHFVTAHDTEFSLKRVLSPANAGGLGATILGLIKGAAAFHAGTTERFSGVRVQGSRVLQITITKPAAYFLATLLGFSAVFDPTVVAGKQLGSPSDNFKSNYLTNTCTGNQGAGPFEFVCHDRSSTPHSFYAGHNPMITLAPNPYYYGRKPRLVIEGIATKNAYKSYLDGKVYESDIPPSSLNRWKGSSELREFPAEGVSYFIPNVHLAPFDNLHCRLAAAYALDRKTLADRVLRGTQHATYALVPKGMLGYYAGNDNPHYNLGRARSEFARCPSRTTPVELTVNPFLRNIGEAAVQDLVAAGFNVKLKAVSFDDFNLIAGQSLDKTGTQIIFGGWGADYPDPQDFCSLLLHSGSPFNLGGWSDVTYDRLVDRADGIPGRKARAGLYIQAQHLAFSQGALISLGYEINYTLLKPYVHGLVFTQAYPWQQPRNGDWANVWVSPH